MSMFDKPILVFQTDFTYKEGAVSAMYGVVKTVDRELEIFDGTHEIPQYDWARPAGPAWRRPPTGTTWSPRTTGP